MKNYYGVLQPGETKTLEGDDKLQPVIASNFATIKSWNTKDVVVENTSSYIAIYAIVFVDSKAAKIINNVDWLTAVTMLSSKQGREEVLKRLMVIGMTRGVPK